jgi:hypothetical protein
MLGGHGGRVPGWERLGVDLVYAADAAPPAAPTGAAIARRIARCRCTSWIHRLPTWMPVSPCSPPPSVGGDELGERPVGVGLDEEDEDCGCRPGSGPPQAKPASHLVHGDQRQGQQIELVVKQLGVRQPRGVSCVRSARSPSATSRWMGSLAR